MLQLTLGLFKMCHSPKKEGRSPSNFNEASITKPNQNPKTDYSEKASAKILRKTLINTL